MKKTFHAEEKNGTHNCDGLLVKHMKMNITCCVGEKDFVSLYV